MSNNHCDTCLYREATDPEDHCYMFHTEPKRCAKHQAPGQPMRSYPRKPAMAVAMLFGLLGASMAEAEPEGDDKEVDRG